MTKFSRIVVLTLVAACFSLSGVGCKSWRKDNADHPRTDHPQGEHPKGDHPKH